MHIATTCVSGYPRTMWRVWSVCVLMCSAVILAGCEYSVATSGNVDERTPLEKAAQDGSLAEVKRLLASGANPNETSGRLGSPLTAAAFRRNNSHIVRVLLGAGADPNGRRPEGNRCWVSPLTHAATNGDMGTVTVLLDAGASLEEQPDCSTLRAARLEPPMLDLLVSRVLNLQRVDKYGRNHLHIALSPPSVPRPAAIEYLIRTGVPVNARDNQGLTPLAYWEEPRWVEEHWFQTWLIERLSGDPEFQRQRKAREEITRMLSRSGAVILGRSHLRELPGACGAYLPECSQLPGPQSSASN